MNEQELTVQEIVEDLEAVDKELHTFERKYGVATAVFYELYCQGKLDNDGYELTEDLGMWAGAYQIKLDREQRFLELSHDYVHSLEARDDGGGLRLILQGESVGV